VTTGIPEPHSIVPTGK